MDKKAQAVVDRLIEYASKNSDAEVLRYMRDKAESVLREGVVIVRHSGEIDASQKTLLFESAKKRFPDAQDVKLERDDSLIGGIEIVFRDYRYDGSVRGKLEELKTKLIEA